MENSRICFIGCGNMGRSLIGGLLANGHPADRICATDIDPDQRQRLNSLYQVSVLENNNQAIDAANIVVFAVKPQVLRETVSALAKDLQRSRPLLISVAAGIRLRSLAQWAGPDQAIIRVMPNTPALIQTGASALCANENVSHRQRDAAEAIMRSVGLALWLEDESLLDTVTAISGSGPAYFFLMMEIMEKTAIELGLTAEQARILTLQTALGAAKMALESDLDPATLRRQVTSPGGTTEQALNVLLAGEFEKLFATALTAARQRAIEIADSLGD